MIAEVSAPTTPLLEVRNLTVRFGGLLAVSDLNLAISPGKTFALVGPNGAGKTTVLNCISGFVQPSSGSISFAETPLLPLGRDKRAALGIGRTFQQLQLFASMSVLDNLLIAQHTRLHAGIFQGILPFGPSKKEDRKAREQARATLALLGLEQNADDIAGTLSFGLQKLVGVARALVLHPRLVLLDEPAAGIPHKEVEALASRLLHWRAEIDTTFLLIEHNMFLVQAVSDYVYVLNYGSKLAEGDPKSVLKEPAVLEAYLGREPVNQAESASQAEKEG